jgi:lipopolysaccharide transport system permease protein
MTQVVEGFRFITIGEGAFNYFHILTALLIAVGIFLAGLIIFNKTEKSFIDTV